MDGMLHFSDPEITISHLGLSHIEGVGHNYPADFRLLVSGWMFSDAVMVSAGCLRSEPEVCCTLAPFPDLLKYRMETLCKPMHPIQVIITNSGNIPLDRPLFHVPNLKVVVYTAVAQVESLIAKVQSSALESEVEIIGIKAGSPSDGLNLKDVLYDLKERGIDHLDVSAGGTVISSMLDYKLLDEIRQTTTGHIIGSSNSEGTPRPRMFPIGSRSYSAHDSPLVAWRGIRYRMLT
jgi:riboflavin biosynthesis pyrimidine reductase